MGSIFALMIDINKGMHPHPILLHSGLEDIDTFAEDRSHVKASALSRLSDLKFETTSSLNQGTDRTTPSPKKCRIKVADVGHVVEYKQQTISLFLVQCTCTQCTVILSYTTYSPSVIKSRDNILTQP